MKSAALTCLLLSSLTLPGLALAQDTDYHHNNFVFGLGPAMPVGNTTNYLSTAPMLDVGYGYRFNRWLQADAGFQTVFGAANNQNPELTNVGTVQGGDHEFMVPMGGRVYIPQPFQRFEFSAGGGAAYLHYSETVSSGAIGYSIGCYSCTSRDGWGGYGLLNGSFYLDSNRNFRVGTTLQFIAASTSGQAVGDVPALRTTDHWTNLIFEFGFSF